MERNFESAMNLTVKEHQVPGGSVEVLKTNRVVKDWNDPELPPNVETFSFQAVFKGYKNYDENLGRRGPDFASLEGIGFGISREKLSSVEAGRGDRIKIEKLASDGTYHGDGIVKITNLDKNLSATIKDWEELRRTEFEELRKENIS